MAKKKRTHVKWDKELDESFLADWGIYKNGEMSFEELQEIYGKHTNKAFQDHAFLLKKDLVDNANGAITKHFHSFESIPEPVEEPWFTDMLESVRDFYAEDVLRCTYYVAATIGWVMLSVSLYRAF